MAVDEDLRQAIFQALARHPHTANLVFRVGVLNGIAHLAGEAASRAVWEQAGEVAAGVPGVRGVVNRISAPGAPSPNRTIEIYLTRGDEW